MILFTHCNNCIFKKNNKCLLSKSILNIDGQQVCEGYCRYKRTYNWVQKNKPETILKMRDLINHEELYMTAILFLSNQDPNALKDMIKKIKKINGRWKYLAEIFIIGVDIPSKLLLEYHKILKDSKLKIGWKISNLHGGEDEYRNEIYFTDAVNYAVKDIKHNWFIGLDTSFDINKDIVEKIYEHLENVADNSILFYSPDSNFVCANKFPFIEMSGNVGIPFLEKLQNFDNWEGLCHQIG